MDGRPMSKETNIRLRNATRADIPLLQYWDQQPHRKESDPNSDWQWETEVGKELPWRQQLISELDGRPIGYIEILHCAMDEEHYWGEVPFTWAAIDIWIGEKADIGRGFGTRMLQLAIARCFLQAHINTVVLDPMVTNTKARTFYERNGFTFVEERFFGPDHCAVYRFDRAMFESNLNAGS
jgi:aminoglycoside 6'-N-acetyltransferase